MNTNNIKSFAREARIILREGVKQRLFYWGFADDGSNTQSMDEIHGGYIYRAQVYTDTTVPAKWKKLKKRLADKQAVLDVMEEAAYTWFNRLMAIKILEVNGYIPEQLKFSSAQRTPAIVQNAKRGQHDLTKQSEKDLLLEYLQEDKEEQAFALLITNFCNKNHLLRAVFGHIDDYTEILLPQNLLMPDALLDLINSNTISEADYKEVELIGWLYQFYISDRKDEVFAGFKKNKKARAEDIPAATQIFTPKWIVKYMVENTVGKIYLDYEPHSELKDKMRYLVKNATEQKETNPLISKLSELTLLDPACGSGHILVTGFDLLFLMYREEGYSAKQAVLNILEHNLYGLDIDDRAMQLARFAVLIKAAFYYPEILTPLNGASTIVLPHIFSFPNAEHFTNEEIQDFLGYNGTQFTADLREILILLNQGKNIGSALKLNLNKEAYKIIETQYKSWTTNFNKGGILKIHQEDTWNRIKPFIEGLIILCKKYTSVVANPPYMGQKNMNSDLKDYINSHYPLTKSDLFAVFIEAMTSMLNPNARVGCITMESWMFLSSYEKLRSHLLDNFSIVSLAHFGWHILGIAFGTAALIIEDSKDIIKGEYSYLTIDDVDRVKNEPLIFPKKNNGRYAKIPQSNFSKIPGSPIAYWVSERERDLYSSGSYFQSECYPKKGIDTGENDYFLRFWYEINFNKGALKVFDDSKYWFPYNKGGEYRKWYGNREIVVNWENNGEKIKSRLSWKSKKPTIRNSQYHFREGFTWTTVSSSGFTCRYVPKGCLFDNGGCTLFADNQLFYLGAMLNTNVAKRYFEFLSPTLNFQPGDIGRMLYYKPNSVYESVEQITKKLIEISRKDYNSREVSWDFEKSPLLNNSSSLIKAYLDWKQQVTNHFFYMLEKEEELNSIFINIYGLQKELKSDIHIGEVTILHEELVPRKKKQKRTKVDNKEKWSPKWSNLERLHKVEGSKNLQLPFNPEVSIFHFISYSIGICLGRYRLDKPGLNIAHPNPSEEELAPYKYNNTTIEIDEDAILPIMGENCAFPDDALVRSKEIILAVWGENTLTENMNFLHECLGINLHKWLNEKFWGCHTKMYKKKPIYWLFSSNPKKPQNAGFKVLVYMHRMDKYTVQKIQRDYLHPHQEYINREIERLEENEDSLDRLKQKRLEMFRDWRLECRDYNEVLKELANQQIEFDLDDGVDVNYKKFEPAVAKI